jgi:hypothetical protein
LTELQETATSPLSWRAGLKIGVLADELAFWPMDGWMNADQALGAEGLDLWAL